jgi:predicted ATPase
MSDAGAPTEDVVLAKRFELRAKLGEGGMGIVHRAWDRERGLEVALKRMRGVGASAAHAIKAEFRARAALQHRGIVQLYELVVDGDDCFLTMELIEGTGLLTWVRTGQAAAAAPEGPRSPIMTTRRVPRGEQRSLVDHGDGLPALAPPIDAAGVARLRAALIELAGALIVLHDAGVVHRDLTPANVLVAPSGRVVVLDFGLAGYSREPRPGSDGVVAGTPIYMAPEQLRAEPTTPAVDCYAVGVILYELLGGRAPFVGSDELIGFSKRSGARPEPLTGTADGELAALAMDLLAPDPAARPSARQVLTRLGRSGARGSSGPTFGLPGSGQLVGRDAELWVLEQALARVTAEKRPVAVIVEGASGIGKTTLVRHFLAAVQRRRDAATVLTARCHPQETVPFKAVDAAIDQLGERLRDGSPSPLPPAQATALGRLFPVLAALPVLATAAKSESVRDDGERRALGFEGLRHLLAGLASRGPLVLSIDDVQWDDGDSQMLLDAVLRARDAPPLLLLLGLRRGAGQSAIVARLEADPPLVPVERIILAALDAGAVARLAATFLGEGDPRIPAVVAQGEGNAFLICELARYLAARPAPGSEAVLDVTSLVEARLGELAPAERALLDVAAVAGGPLPTEWALAAAGLGSSAQPAALALRDAYLVRLDVTARGEVLTPYHDKIAEATRQLMPADRTRQVHGALAAVLAQRAPEDADALCTHFAGAGDTARAGAEAFRAANHAAAALAFGHAADLYDKALALGYAGVPAAVLLERAGDALANQGLAKRAAERYLDASAALGDAIADGEVRSLKRKAAEQYVKSGYINEGWRVMAKVLAAAGLPEPRSARWAMTAALARRLGFLLRRVDVDDVGDRQIPADERARLEILWTASTSMSMVDVGLSDYFRTQHLGRIVEVGDASSIARAFAYEAALEVHVGGKLFDGHAARLLAHASRLVERTADPYDRAWLELGFANQAFCAGRFADAVAACQRSLAILGESLTGVAWEETTVAAFLLTSLAMVGDLPSLRAASERLAADGERRGDLFAIAEAGSGECVLGHFTQGAASAGAALARARRAVARQGQGALRWPEKTYRRGQLTELMGTVHFGLLSGDPASAWTAVLTHWPGLEASLLLTLQFYGSWLRHGRARVALALAQQGGTTGWPPARLRADAARMRKHVAKDDRPFAAPWAAAIAAALAHGDGDSGRTQAALDAAVDGFERAGMALYREAARYQAGRLGARPDQCAQAEAALLAQGVGDVPALAEALVPGFRDLK